MISIRMFLFICSRMHQFVGLTVCLLSSLSDVHVRITMKSQWTPKMYATHWNQSRKNPPKKIAWQIVCHSTIDDWNAHHFQKHRNILRMRSSISSAQFSCRVNAWMSDWVSEWENDVITIKPHQSFATCVDNLNAVWLVWHGKRHCQLHKSLISLHKEPIFIFQIWTFIIIKIMLVTIIMYQKKKKRWTLAVGSQQASERKNDCDWMTASERWLIDRKSNFIMSLAEWVCCGK